jgi:hypothetical protein
MEAKRMIQRINETKSWLFVKINKIDKSFTKVIRRKTEKILIKIKDEKSKYHSKHQ